MGKQQGETWILHGKRMGVVDVGVPVQNRTVAMKNATDHVGQNEGSTAALAKPSQLFLAGKRGFDIIIALLAGAVLILPMLILAILIRIDSPGPALFKQERLGKDGKPFIMYKFRSMYLNAEINGPQWARKDDQRCTRLGHFLRNCRLDELPQLWNILKGDMSLVGPRPERACFYEQFETYIPGFRRRLQVKPGLTGLAQVNGGYDLLPEEKIVYDMRYIEQQSFRLDLYCIAKTASLIFTHRGAR